MLTALHIALLVYTASLLLDFASGISLLWQQSAPLQPTIKYFVESEEPAIAQQELIESQYWQKADELQLIGIRELKKLASDSHIKGYGRLTKTQLIEALL
jgi:hypothetical protein